MKKFTLAAATIGTLTVTAVGMAWASTGTSSAADTIENLRSDGYNVQINGTPTDPLSQCSVTGVDGLSGSNTDAAGRLVNPNQFTTVYVDIACPDDH